MSIVWSEGREGGDMSGSVSLLSPVTHWSLDPGPGTQLCHSIIRTSLPVSPQYHKVASMKFIQKIKVVIFLNSHEDKLYLDFNFEIQF